MAKRTHSDDAAVRWSAFLPRWPSRLWASLSAGIVVTADRRFDRLPLRADRYDRRFFLAAGGVLAFTVLAYWSLTFSSDAGWLRREDGLSEWRTVAAYLASAGMAAATARSLRRLRHRRLGTVHILLAVGLLLAALEEVSWGQRLFGWSTPAAFATINEQNETTLHNITEFDRVANSIVLLAALLGLSGAAARAVLHRRGRVTSADFVLPSLILAPALILIAAWMGGGPLFRTFMEYFDLRPIGDEIPEVLAGLCVLLFTYANLRRAGALLSG